MHYLKNIENGFIFLLVLMLGSACHQTEIPTSDGSLIGAWQLVEQKVSIGGPAEWTKVRKGNVYVFSKDGRWENRGFESCGQGTYELKGDALKFEFGCSDALADMVYDCQFEGREFTIYPTSVRCVEECLYRYRKL